MNLKKFLTLVIITSVLVFLLNIILGYWSSAVKYLPYYLIYSTGFAIGNWLYFYAIGHLMSWEKNPEKTLIISILGVIPVNALIYFLLNLFFRVIIGKQDFNTFIKQINVLEYTFVILFALVIALFIIIGHFFKAIREEKLKAEQLKTQNERAKFESLKNQLDPHFLFNNLNVLTALIGENPNKAEEFSMALSDIYKYVLEQKDKELVPLQEELAFAEKYLSLLKMRYEDDLIYTLPDNIPENAKIPPLSLQMLLENTVKHNSITANNPLKINLEINNDYLIISNNKNPKPHNIQQGIGLQNIIKRYKLLTQKPVNIKDDQEKFEVQIPIL